MLKKKLLHLITGLEVGGTEIMLLKSLPKMQASFDNRVCCIKGRGQIGKKLVEAGIPVYYLDLKNIFDFGVILRFRNVVQDFQPDILVTYLIHADLLGRIAGRILGIKKIVSNQRGSLLNWEFLRFFDKMTKFLVTGYIVQTNCAKKELMKKINISGKKIQVIPNSIDVSDFEFRINKNNKKLSLGVCPNNLNVVCVSNLRKGKGHEYLLEAFEDAHRKRSDINLLIVGDGEERASLEKQVKGYNSVNNIYFLGNRNDVKEILKVSDIFILPTLAEGMSNAILEAMASSLPIITTDIPPNLELIENQKSGILVPPKNPQAISNALLRIIDNPGLRDSLAHSALARCKRYFSLSETISKQEKFYSSLI